LAGRHAGARGGGDARWSLHAGDPSNENMAARSCNLIVITGPDVVADGLGPGGSGAEADSGTLPRLRDAENHGPKASQVAVTKRSRDDLGWRNEEASIDPGRAADDHRVLRMIADHQPDPPNAKRHIQQQSQNPKCTMADLYARPGRHARLEV
jgi:hypothetical protein